MTDLHLHLHPKSWRGGAASGVAVALLALAPPARAAPLLGEELSVDGREARPVLLAAARPKASAAASLDFDLLGAPPPARRIDDAALRMRRRMLDVHQGIGLGLVALELGTTIVGQLNYSDRFGSSNPPATARYQSAHATLAYTTLGAFAVNGLLALLAPSPKGRAYAFDRVMVHRIGMSLAAAGMLSQGVLGVATRHREGRLDQERLARAHLAVGYATFAAFGVAVGALVF